MTIKVSGVGIGAGITPPVFSVYRNASQTVTAATYTKLQLNAELFDSNSFFDSTTNFRFQPTIAGYYQFSWCLSGTSTSAVSGRLYMNGAAIAEGSWATATAGSGRSTGSYLVLLNGSTDYIELWGWVDGPSAFAGGSAILSYLTGYFVRS